MSLCAAYQGKKSVCTTSQHAKGKIITTPGLNCTEEDGSNTCSGLLTLKSNQIADEDEKVLGCSLESCSTLQTLNPGLNITVGRLLFADHARYMTAQFCQPSVIMAGRKMLFLAAVVVTRARSTHAARSVFPRSISGRTSITGIIAPCYG